MFYNLVGQGQLMTFNLRKTRVNMCSLLLGSTAKLHVWDQLQQQMYCIRPVDLISEITALGLTFLKGELVQRPGVLKYIVLLHWTQQGNNRVKHLTQSSLDFLFCSGTSQGAKPFCRFNMHSAQRFYVINKSSKLYSICLCLQSNHSE